MFFLELSLAFWMIWRMLAIWSLVPLPFLNPALTSGSAQFMKPALENFEHYFASMWDECNCVVLWTFFGIGFLWDWNENWPFLSSGHCWIFQICWDIDCTALTASSFRIWDNSAGIPLLLLALFVVMLPKAHLASHSRISDSSWVTTSLWLSGSLKPFGFSSSVYSFHLFLISSASVGSVLYI